MPSQKNADTDKRKPIRILAAEAGIPERKFFRMVKRLDASATRVLQAEVIWHHRQRFDALAEELTRASDRLTKTDPAFAGRARALSGELRELIAAAKGVSKRPLEDWRLPDADILDNLDLSVLFNDSELTETPERNK